MLYLERSLCVIDSEWTSLNPEIARMLSLAVERITPDISGGDMQALAECASERHLWRFNPGVTIDAETIQVHGITDEMAAQCRPFRVYANDIRNMLTGADIAGYGLRGDIRLLQREFQLSHVGFGIGDAYLVDAYRLWSVRSPRRLEDAYAHFSCKGGEIPADIVPHEAHSDVVMARAVIEDMNRVDDAPDNETVVSVRELHDEAFPNMIDRSGYFIYDDARNVRFTFGKHKGKLASETLGYIRWMLREGDFPPDTRAVCDSILNPPYAGDPYGSSPDFTDDDIPF